MGIVEIVKNGIIANGFGVRIVANGVAIGFNVGIVTNGVVNGFGIDVFGFWEAFGSSLFC